MAGINCGKLDLTKLPQDELITINNKTWIKADVDEKIYVVNNKPYVVVKFSDTCLATVCDDQNELNPALAHLINNHKESNNQPPSPGSDCLEESCSQETTRSLPENINNNSDEANARNGIDLNSLNIFSWYPAAVKPTAVVVPMKSNIKTYGPYASSNFGTSCGGTQVEINTDLAPWVFGSIGSMNQAGSSIVESTAIGLVRSETGSISIPGLPGSEFTGLGIAIGGAGPTLSSINFSYGSNGISTNYEFRTYTPKFGSLNRHFLDKFKSITKNRTEQIRFLRNNQIIQNKISRKLRNIAGPPRNQNRVGGTLQRVFVADIYDWLNLGDSYGYGQSTNVGISTLRKSIEDMSYNYDKKAFMSLDGLFGPVSIGGDGGLPRFAQSSTDPYKQSLSKNPYPPFRSNYYDEINNLNIDKTHLNPLTNKVDQNNHYHNGPGCGHAIDMVGRETTVPKDGLITNFYGLDDANRYSNDYRFLGMRGPIVLHSWGYDLDGKPIPNEADNDENTKLGSFTTSNLTDRFLPNWLGKPATWPVAPIDLRFDRNRGVWVSPPSPSIIVAKLEYKLEANSSCEATILFDDQENTIYNKDGAPVQNGKITVYDKLGCSYDRDTKIYAYFNTCFNKYIVLEACASASDAEYPCPPLDSDKKFTIGKVDLQTIPGWNKTMEQMLGHDENGCLKWIDTTACPPPTPTPTPTP